MPLINGLFIFTNDLFFPFGGSEFASIYSQRGNILFPVWEYFVPNVGIIFSLNGIFDPS